MSYADLLINECDIQRFTEDGTYDAYGQPNKTWADIYTDEPCRHVTGKGREIRIGQEVHIVYDQLFVGDLVITVQDRVIIDGDTYQIIDVLFRQDGVSSHHKQAYLERVS